MTEQRRLSSIKSWLAFIALLIRLALGCLFLWSSLAKLRLPYEFLGNVYDYQLVGPSVGVTVAMILPWFELITGICLLGGVLVSGALLACMAMATAFIIAISWALHNSLNISCGCFGSASGRAIGYETLIRTILVLGCSAVGYALEVFKQGRDSRAQVKHGPSQNDPSTEPAKIGARTPTLADQATCS